MKNYLQNFISTYKRKSIEKELKLVQIIILVIMSGFLLNFNNNFVHIAQQKKIMLLKQLRKILLIFNLRGVLACWVIFFEPIGFLTNCKANFLM